MQDQIVQTQHLTDPHLDPESLLAQLKAQSEKLDGQAEQLRTAEAERDAAIKAGLSVSS